MNKSFIYNFIKAAAFLLLVFCMLAGILKVFNYKDMGGGGGWQRFYEAEDGSIDVMFFGNSHAHCTVDHGLLWEKYGMAGYTLSAGSQTVDGACYFVKEALRSQQPKVIAVEVMGALGGEISNSDSDVYRNSLGMEWSLEFAGYVDYLADNMGMDRQQKQRVFLKIPVVHSRYAELVRSDFEDPIPFMRGYRGSYEREVLDTPQAVSKTQVMELDPLRLEMLKEIVDTAEQNQVPVVLFAAPFKATEEEQMQLHAVEAFAQQEGIPFINYNEMYEELSLDFETDFRDGAHVNNDGAVKVTDHLGEYLTQHYQIPDRRGQKGYEVWEDNALYLRNKALRNQLERAADINAYLQILSELEEEQTVIIALTGNYNALGDVYLEKLMQLGITAEEYAKGGAFIFRGGERIGYLPGKEYDDCLKTVGGEINISSVQYEVGEEIIDEAHIWLEGVDYVMVKNGVNVLVYHEPLKQLIDAAGDDVYLGLELIHCDKEEE